MSRTTTVVGWAKDHPFRAAGLVCVAMVIALIGGLVLGSSVDQLPTPGSVSEAGVSATPTGGSEAPSAAAPEPGNSGNVTSSTGVDWGAGLERLGDSPFARTSDPQVFAASVQAATGYDYWSYQPTSATEEQERITSEWLAGMSGEDGPLGAEVHRVMRQSVGDSIDPEELSYRIAARQVDSIDVLAVQPTDNAALRAQGGNDVYLAVIGDRQRLHALTTVATVTTEVQAVGDVSGFKRTQTTAVSMIVRCDPEVNEGNCELVGLIGGGAQ